MSLDLAWVPGTGAEQSGVGIGVDNTTVVDMVRMKVCGLSRGDAQAAVEDAVWSLLEATVVPEAQGGRLSNLPLS